MALSTFKKSRNGYTYKKGKITQATRNQNDVSSATKKDILPKIVVTRKKVKII